MLLLFSFGKTINSVRIIISFCNLEAVGSAEVLILPVTKQLTADIKTGEFNLIIEDNIITVSSYTSNYCVNYVFKLITSLFAF